jgi:hypothetical protein
MPPVPFELAVSESCALGREQESESSADSNACCGGADDVEDVVGVGQDGDVAAVDVVGRG